MGVNPFLWNLQKFNKGKIDIIERSLDFMFNTSRGRQGIYPNVLSAHQPHSAADPESPLRPAALKHPPCLMTPSATEPLTLKPLNWNSRGVTGKERKDDEEAVGWGGWNQHRHLFILRVSSFTLLKYAVRIWISLRTWRRRGCVTQEEHVRTVEWNVQQVVSLSIPSSLHLWPHSHLTSCFLESHPALLTHTLWSHFTGKILWSREDFLETEEH